MVERTPLTVTLKTSRGSIRLDFQVALVVEGRPIVLSQPDRMTPRSDGWQGAWDRVSADIPLSVELSADKAGQGDEIVIAARITNIGERSVCVDYFQPLWMDQHWGSSLDLGGSDRRIKVFAMTPESAGYGTRVEELCCDDTPEEYAVTDRLRGLESSGVTVLYVPVTQCALVAGFTDFSHQFGSFSITHGAGGVYRMIAELECLKPLRPGRQLEMSPLWLAAGFDPLELLERYAERLRDQMHIRLSPEDMPCGWLSWYGYRVTLTEEDVRANAAIVRQQMLPLGGRLCVIDLGWNEGDRPGDWSKSNDRFPSAVENVLGELAAQGLQPGLWSTPLLVSEKSRVAQEHPEWLLRGTDGKPVFITEWYWEPMEDCYCLDPSLPDVRAHVENVYRTFRSWGVEMFKLDFSGAFQPGFGNPASPTTRRLPVPYAVADGNRLEQCRRLYAMIRQAIGSAHMMVVNTPWQGVVGITDSLYLANDAGNQTDSESQDERPRRRGWDYVRERSRQVFARWFMHGRAWWGNPECFVAENDAPDDHSRVRLQVVMLGGGQYKCSNRLPTWRPDRLASFLKGLPWYGKAAVPIDLFDTECPRLLDLAIETEWDAWHVIGVFNWESRKSEIRLGFERLRPAATGAQLVWDFWDHRLLGLTSDGITVTVPAESGTLVGVRPCTGRPQVLGTDLHFTMGWAEIPTCRWDEATHTLSGVARRCVGARGKLFIHVPTGWRHPNAVRAASGGAVLTLPFTFAQADVPWSISFQREQSQ